MLFRSGTYSTTPSSGSRGSSNYRVAPSDNYSTSPSRSGSSNYSRGGSSPSISPGSTSPSVGGRR